jgi:hypothetical protein
MSGTVLNQVTGKIECWIVDFYAKRLRFVPCGNPLDKRALRVVCYDDARLVPDGDETKSCQWLVM